MYPEFPEQKIGQSENDGRRNNQKNYLVENTLPEKKKGGQEQKDNPQGAEPAEKLMGKEAQGSCSSGREQHVPEIFQVLKVAGSYSGFSAEFHPWII